MINFSLRNMICVSVYVYVWYVCVCAHVSVRRGECLLKVSAKLTVFDSCSMAVGNGGYLCLKEIYTVYCLTVESHKQIIISKCSTTPSILLVSSHAGVAFQCYSRRPFPVVAFHSCNIESLAGPGNDTVIL